LNARIEQQQRAIDALESGRHQARRWYTDHPLRGGRR
jgi:hypothetical protein